MVSLFCAGAGVGSVRSDGIEVGLASGLSRGDWAAAGAAESGTAAVNSKSAVPALLPTFTRFAASNSKTCSLVLNDFHLTQHSKVASFRFWNSFEGSSR